MHSKIGWSRQCCFTSNFLSSVNSVAQSVCLPRPVANYVNEKTKKMKWKCGNSSHSCCFGYLIWVSVDYTTYYEAAYGFYELVFTSQRSTQLHRIIAKLAVARFTVLIHVACPTTACESNDQKGRGNFAVCLHQRFSMFFSEYNPSWRITKSVFLFITRKSQSEFTKINFRNFSKSFLKIDYNVLILKK